MRLTMEHGIQAVTHRLPALPRDQATNYQNEDQEEGHQKHADSEDSKPRHNSMRLLAMPDEFLWIPASPSST